MDTNSKMHHVSCSFKGKQSGDESFFISIEPQEAIPGLPTKCIIGLSLRNPKSRKQAELVEKFLDDNLAGISITTW